MVPGAGLEPARYFYRKILSLVCLPIPPPGHRAWRLESESNRRTRSCSPLHNHSAIQPFGAGNETRTRDPNLGKVVLYQLSYSRLTWMAILQEKQSVSTFFLIFFSKLA